MKARSPSTVILSARRLTCTLIRGLGTPGQHRFWFMWDELAQGALGAIVLADTRRLDDCFASVDFFERRQIPFVLAVNCFHGIQPYTTDDVRDAIDLDSFVPIIMGDVRQRQSSKQILVTLLEHLITIKNLAQQSG
jgi:signal recognition particle receptor subunit beta